MKFRLALTVAATAALAACGQKAALEPPPGQTLPPAPYGSEVRPTADELLESDGSVSLERDTELRTQSEEREDDPFDLPPE